MIIASLAEYVSAVGELNNVVGTVPGSRDVTVPGLVPINRDFIIFQITEKNGSVTPTPLFVPSVVMFCHRFRYKLRVSAWAVGSCSIGPPAWAILEKIVFQTLRLMGQIALYTYVMSYDTGTDSGIGFSF